MSLCSLNYATGFMSPLTVISNRWNLEATFGFGYVYLDHSRYECKTCGEKLGRESKHYLGPTKVGVSLIYVIK